MDFYNRADLEEYLIREIKVRDLLLDHGFTIRGNRTCSVIEPGGNNTVSEILNNKNAVTDYKNGRGRENPINSIELNKILNNLNDDEESIQDLMQKNNLFLKVSKEVKDKQNANNIRLINYNNTLKSNEYKSVLDYIENRRGLPKEFILNTVKIGYDPTEQRIMIPFLDTMGNAIRFTGEDYTRQKQNKYKNDPLEEFYANEYRQPLNYDTRFNRPKGHEKELYLCEGIYCGLTLKHLGFCTLSFGGGTASDYTWNEYIIPECKRDIFIGNRKYNREIVLIPDNDDAGKKNVIKWIKRLLRERITNIKVCIPPKFDENKENIEFVYTDHFLTEEETQEILLDAQREEISQDSKRVQIIEHDYGTLDNFLYTLELNTDYKDVSDYFGKNKNIDAILNTKVDFYIYLAKKYQDDFEEFYNFFNHYKTFFNQRQLEKILIDLEKLDIFNKEDLKDLKKSFTTPPSEVEIVNLLDREGNLLYHSNKHFFKYNGKVWEQVENEEIKKEIRELLGKKKPTTTKKRINDIYEHAQIALSQGIKFNQSNVIVFNNVTVEINEKNKENLIAVRESNKKDFCTAITGYDYNPDAKCDKWEEAISQIMSNDPNKIALLQEFCGYTLLRTNKLEKALYLQGKGGNGKSLITNIMKAVLGNDNCSYVKLNEFSNEHKLVRMENKFLNISSETPRAVNDMIEIFKQIVSGESQEASYKFRDVYSFDPTCKLVISANDPISVSYGNSDAVARRLLFIECKETFSDNDGTADHDLKDKLLDELDGIFNWFIEGLERLLIKQDGKFTHTTEEEILKEAFIKDSSIIHNFIIYEIEECLTRGFESLFTPDSQLDKFKDTGFTSQFAYKRFNEYIGGARGNSGIKQAKFDRDFCKVMREEFPYFINTTDGDRRGYYIEPEYEHIIKAFDTALDGTNLNLLKDYYLQKKEETVKAVKEIEEAGFKLVEN